PPLPPFRPSRLRRALVMLTVAPADPPVTRMPFCVLRSVEQPISDSWALPGAMWKPRRLHSARHALRVLLWHPDTEKPYPAFPIASTSIRVEPLMLLKLNV